MGKKIVSKEKLKMGIITDTQVHPSRKNKFIKGPNVQRYLKPKYGDAIDAFVAEMKVFLTGLASCKPRFYGLSSRTNH